MFAVEDSCIKSLIILTALITLEERGVTGYRNFLLFYFNVL